ncbi:PREDICTED: importin subunit alpha-5-like [Atta cephalotes]|uniref:Importin subunit alpha n=1 Tax=Atta cephalotes TaxID=12957 RepID=A0A158NQV5_ATTCE|nr:PREDICTED: importin subunit alpha-5-like [Atta cephalotes]
MSSQEDDSNKYTAKFESDMIEFDKEYQKKRIENDVVQLCKTIKDNRLFKRNLDMEQELIDSVLSSTSDLSVDKIVNYINSSDETLQLLGIQAYAKLKREKNPSINDTIEDDILPRCIKLLDKDTISFQFQIASLLAIITSNTFKQTHVITCEVISKLIKLLKSSPIVAEQAVRALGNIIEDKPRARDFALKYNVLSLLADLIKSDTSVIFMDNISWLLSNLCQGNIPLNVELIRPVLPVFHCLFNIKNQYIISDICRTLSYLTNGFNNVQAIMETIDILPKLLECLTLRKEIIVIPALRTIGNIVTIGDDTHKNVIISAGGLLRLGDVLRYYLCVDEEDIVKEALWAIFKMVDNTDRIQSVINADLLPLLIEGFQFENAQKIATWTVIALITGGTIQHLIQLVQAGVLQAFCNLLESNNYLNIIDALIGMAEILHAAEKIGQTEKLTIMIKKFGGLDKIEDLQYHKNERVYAESLAIINTYFLQREARINEDALSVELCKAKEDDRLSNCNLDTNQALPDLSKINVTLTSRLSIEEIMISLRNIVKTMFHLCKKNPPLAIELIRPILPIFSYLFTIRNQSVISSTCWILAYLTDGCDDNIHALLETGILPQVLGCLMSQAKNIFVPALRTVAHIVESGDTYKTNAVIFAGGLSHLYTLLRNCLVNGDTRIVVEIVSAIYKMVNTKEQIQCVIDAGLLSPLIEILECGTEEAQYIVAWTVMDIITIGSIENLNELINAGLLSIFCNLLEAKNYNNIINVFDCLTEILRAAEKVEQTEKFIIMIKEAGIIDKIETIQYHHDDLIYKMVVI